MRIEKVARDSTVSVPSRCAAADLVRSRIFRTDSSGAGRVGHPVTRLNLLNDGK